MVAVISLDLITRLFCQHNAKCQVLEDQSLENNLMPTEPLEADLDIQIHGNTSSCLHLIICMLYYTKFEPILSQLRHVKKFRFQKDTSELSSSDKALFHRLIKATLLHMYFGSAGLYKMKKVLHEN